MNLLFIDKKKGIYNLVHKSDNELQVQKGTTTNKTAALVSKALLQELISSVEINTYRKKKNMILAMNANLMTAIH